MSSNPWIQHVKQYVKSEKEKGNNISYACAITEASKTYKKKEKPKKEEKPKLTKKQAIERSNARDKQRALDEKIKKIVAENNKEAQKEIMKRVPKKNVKAGAKLTKEIKDKYFEKSRREINALTNA